MIRKLNKDTFSLGIKSMDATIADLDTAKDLEDTLAFYQNKCVGMAANMIGVHKRIIIFYDEKMKKNRVMFNPVIVEAKDEYACEEGCLCLEGVRKTKRFRSIKVSFQNSRFETKIQTFHDFTAQIIQHEIDMCNGILI